MFWVILMWLGFIVTFLTEEPDPFWKILGIVAITLYFIVCGSVCIQII